MKSDTPFDEAHEGWPLSNFEKVAEFQHKFGLPVGTEPTEIPAEGLLPEEGRHVAISIRQVEAFIKARRTEDDQMWGRVQMMLEELRELAEAITIGDLEMAADSLVDLDYFLLGTAVMMGLPYDALFAEVHRANMDKVRVESATEGKRLNKLDCKKPEGWQPPNIARVLATGA